MCGYGVECIHKYRWFGSNIERRISDCKGLMRVETCLCQCSCSSHNAELLLPSGVVTLNRKPLLLLLFALREIKYRAMRSQSQKKRRFGANNKDIKANCIYGESHLLFKSRSEDFELSQSRNLKAMTCAVGVFLLSVGSIYGTGFLI